MGLSAGLMTSMVFAVLALAVPDVLLHIFTTDLAVIAEGIKYLRIVGISNLFMSVTQMYLNIMRSIERVLIATVVYFISLILNVILNALLIFRLLGFPELGIQGAATATLCARVSETIMVLLYARFKNRQIRIRLEDMIHIDRVLWKDFMVYAMPVVLNELMWGLGTSANTAIIGHMGSAAVAANSVAQVARQLAKVVVFGISNATAIYLGITAMWGCSILSGFLAAFVFHAGVPVVYLLLMSDEVIKTPISIKRYLSYKWLRDVTREEGGEL